MLTEKRKNRDSSANKPKRRCRLQPLPMPMPVKKYHSCFRSQEAQKLSLDQLSIGSSMRYWRSKRFFFISSTSSRSNLSGKASFKQWVYSMQTAPKYQSPSTTEIQMCIRTFNMNTHMTHAYLQKCYHMYLESIHVYYIYQYI